MSDPQEPRDEPSDHETGTGESLPESIRGQRVIPFEELAQGERVVWIRYRGQLYRLSQTRSGRLVLNK